MMKPGFTCIQKTVPGFFLRLYSCRKLFCRRFDPDFYQVYSKIQEKKLGNLRLIKVTSRDLEAPPISYIKTSGENIITSAN